MIIDFHIIHREKFSPYIGETLASLSGKSYHFVRDHEGYVLSRVKGYSLGTNPYVSFVDDDDVLVNCDKVEDYIKENNPDALYTNSMRIDNLGNHISKIYPETYKMFDVDMLRRGLMIHQLVVIKREIAQKAIRTASEFVLKHNLPLMIDQAFFIEISRLTKWNYLPEVCYHWRCWSNEQAHKKASADYYRLINLYFGPKNRR